MQESWPSLASCDTGAGLAGTIVDGGMDRYGDQEGQWGAPARGIALPRGVHSALAALDPCGPPPCMLPLQEDLVEPLLTLCWGERLGLRRSCGRPYTPVAGVREPCCIPGLLVNEVQ